MTSHRYRASTSEEQSAPQVNQRNLIMDDLSHVSDDSTPPHPCDLRHYVLRDRETHHAFNVKVEIPEFEGKMQPDEFVEWLNAVNRIFDYQDVPENKKDIFLKINNFRQRDLSVAEYTAEFDNLMLKGDVADPEEQSIARYLGGLNYEISNVVQLQPYWSLNDMCKLALKVEKQQNEMRSRGSKYGSRKGFTKKGGTSSSKPTAATKTNTKVSTSKGEDVVSKQQQQPSSSNTNSRRCFKCQGFGHIASKCPNRKIVSSVEEDSDEDEYENEEVAEDVTYGDKGASLVIQRSLSVVREEEEEDWVRKNVFHTKCTSHGKVCVVIIDSGSFENVVSSYMVDKLDLKTVQHPHPYKLSWLQKDNEIKIVLGPSRLEEVSKPSKGEGNNLLTQVDCRRELMQGGEVPFEVVYGKNPTSPLDLVPIGSNKDFGGEADARDGEIKKLHAQVREKIVKQNENKDHFPKGKYGKLKPRADGPFKVLQRIGENAYKIELQESYGVSPTFNVADLAPYHGDASISDLRLKNLLINFNES
ncbi:hypothetical protein EZV62_019013 [Acer yangbiense]|uniref:CCHC-type domain-containing protein n=1 Tax=Acer yangbiense TaxID=1000413 RepID=A0A5C7HA30_9ROSI|nr:hypothetical protein EZV62_019013 [Acer yangbiense]